MDTIPACQVCGHTILLPVIQAKDFSVSSELFQLVECSACGAWFTNPRPNANQIGSYYASDNYISHTNSHESLFDRIYQAVRKRTLVSKGGLVKRLSAKGSLLDVGCGTGQFLLHMQELGFQVLGVEPDDTARHKAAAASQAKVLPNLDSIPSGMRFDVITLWHVLEHTPDVRKSFHQLRNLLVPGGHLIIAIPDRESWDAHHYGSFWAAYDVPRHLNHLRHIDIRRLAEKHGLKFLRVLPMWFDAFYICLLSEGYRGTSKPLAILLGFLLGFWSNTKAVITSRPTSSSLYILRAPETR